MRDPDGVRPDGTAPTDEREAAITRPPGGKALLRELLWLESRGLHAEAREAVATAVDEQDMPAARQIAEQLGVPAVRLEPPTSRRSKKAQEEDAAARETSERLAGAVAQAAAVMGPPTGAGPHWRSLGPWTITGGQTYGSKRINVSGRVSALAVDPSNPRRLLAGAAQGGVWLSTDRGASWSPRTDYQSTLAIGALAFDPANPRVVLCGTGEGDAFWWLGQGVLRSQDHGATWQTLCTAPFVRDGFYSISIDPSDGARVVAGTVRGLWTSGDGGATWRRARTNRCWSVARPHAGAEILAACSDGVFRSTDAGATWNPETLPGAPTGFRRIGVSIVAADGSVAYAWGSGGGSTFLWRRSGGQWRRIPSPPDVNAGQDWYDWYVAAAPDRTDQVYVGAIDVHRADLVGSDWVWRNLSSRTGNGDSIHPDQHCMAFEPGNPDLVYAGGDGGVYRSPNRGTNWTSCNNGLQVSEFEYIAQDAGDYRYLIGGTQDNGTNRWQGSIVWEHVGDADGGDCGVNRQTSNIVFHTRQNGFIFRSANRGDFGSWTHVTPTRPAGEGPGLFYVPVECSASNGDTLAMGGQALYVSRNNAASWTRVGYPSAGTASSVYVPDADTVVVGLTDGRIYRTRWTGAAWSAFADLNGPRPGDQVSDVFATPGGTGRLWATCSAAGGSVNRVFRSDDGGATWQARSTGLPDLPVNTVVVDPANPNRVWVGADVGVYETRNAGASWSPFASGLPNSTIGDLIFHPHARVLRAATRNRGIWEIDVDGRMANPWCGVQFTGSLEPGQSRRWFTFNWPATWHVLWTVMPTTVRRGAPQLTWDVHVERADSEHLTYWITVRNLTNSAASFQGRFCVLSRY